MPEAAKWHVVCVTSGRELRLSEAVNAAPPSAGEAYVPMMTTNVWSSRARRWRKSHRPLLPGYVFVRTDRAPTDHEIQTLLPGTWWRVLRFNDGAAMCASPSEIEALRQAEADGSFDGGCRHHLDFKSGGVYVVRDGAYSGAQVVCIDDIKHGSSRGRFTLEGHRMSLPLYLFAETG